MSIDNNNSVYTERERRIIELYNRGKTTRGIAKILRMSLRDINIILKKHGVNLGIVTIDKDYHSTAVGIEKHYLETRYN